MSNFNTVLDALWATTVGFDPVFTGATRQIASFPHYDVVKHDNDNYMVEIALAGYGPNDVDITYVPGRLTISTALTKSGEVDESRVYKGIAKRNFNLSFALAQYVEVQKTEFDHGLLRIELRRNLPEVYKPRKIVIGYDADQANVLQLQQKQKTA